MHGGHAGGAGVGGLAGFGGKVLGLAGGLGVALIGQNLKVAIAPILSMVILFVCVPSLAPSGAIFVPVAAVIAIAAARLMYKKGWLK